MSVDVGICYCAISKSNMNRNRNRNHVDIVVCTSQPLLCVFFCCFFINLLNNGIQAYITYSRLH